MGICKWLEWVIEMVGREVLFLNFFFFFGVSVFLLLFNCRSDDFFVWFVYVDVLFFFLVRLFFFFDFSWVCILFFVKFFMECFVFFCMLFILVKWVVYFLLNFWNVCFNWLLLCDIRLWIFLLNLNLDIVFLFCVISFFV